MSRPFKTKMGSQPPQRQEDTDGLLRRCARKSKDALEILDLTEVSFDKENPALAASERAASSLLSTWFSVNLTTTKLGSIPASRKLLRFVCAPSEAGIQQHGKRLRESLRAVTSYKKKLGRDAELAVACPGDCDPDVLCKLIDELTAGYGVSSLVDGEDGKQVKVDLSSFASFCCDAIVSASCLSIIKLHREKLLESLVSTMTRHFIASNAGRKEARDNAERRARQFEEEVAELKERCCSLELAASKAKALAASIEGDESARRKELDELRGKAEREGREQAEAFIAEMEDEANRYYSECRLKDRQIRDCDAKITDLQKQLDLLRIENESLAESMGTIAASKPAAPEHASEVCVSSLEELPESVADALRLAARAFDGRIAVTQKALSSAESYNGRSDHDEAWRILRAIATVGYELFFESCDECLDVMREFKERTGFDLALSEMKITKENNRMRKMRTVTHNGVKLDITPHVKGKGKDNPLRVHFACDRVNGVIVIGWCGDHLETVGTKRRSIN